VAARQRLRLLGRTLGQVLRVGAPIQSA
jgi:hypothetical protein